MVQKADENPAWWAKGLLFENCSCTSVCPGHVHFSQACTFERCVGYWAIRVDKGRYADTSLDDCRAVIAYDAPQHMIEGGWTQALIIDRDATTEQRTALEHILCGKAGGPWQVLARFVSRQLPTKILPIRIEDSGRVKRVSIESLLTSTIEAIRGRDRSKTVRLDNMFNQIHASTQVIARGGTRFDDGEIRVDTKESHALYSDFHWQVSGS